MTNFSDLDVVLTNKQGKPQAVAGCGQPLDPITKALFITGFTAYRAYKALKSEFSE